jgi:hypothetical protein
MLFSVVFSAQAWAWKQESSLQSGPSRMGGCGGCDTPPENKLSANEGICRQTKNNIPQNVKLNRDIVGQYSLHSRAILAYNKEKWDKFCQFCEKLCYFAISGKFVLCLEKFWYVRKIFGPLQPPGF